MKSLLEDAGVAPLHELPWSSDVQSYKLVPRLILTLCRLFRLDWAVFYKFQIGAARRESVWRLQQLKRPLARQDFFQDPSFGDLVRKGLRLLIHR
jgi:hypothetical protein